MKQDAGSKHYFSKLASLRFFAALLVLLSHIKLAAATDNPVIRYLDINVFWCGFIGVSIFYVLSGFVISYANDNWRGWKVYLIGRVSRIYPAHWIVTALVILIFSERIAGSHGWLVWLSNFSLLHAWVPSERYFFSLNAVSWSLSVEMFFYCMFLFLRRLQDKYIYALCALGYVVNLVFECLMQHEPVKWVHWIFYIDPLARLPEFLMGMSIYRLYLSRPSRPSQLWQTDFLLIFLAMIAVITALHLNEVNIIFIYSSVPALFAFFMIMALVFGHSSIYMNNRGLVLLGESSFALYLIHKPLLGLARHMVSVPHSHDYLFVMLLAAVVAIGVSIAFYLGIELRATRFLKKCLTALFIRQAPAKGVT